MPRRVAVAMLLQLRRRSCRGLRLSLKPPPRPTTSRRRRFSFNPDAMIPRRQDKLSLVKNLLLVGGTLVGGLLSHLLVLDAACAADIQRVAVAPARGRQSVSLRDRLVVGLQARLTSEVEFVELVALRVQTGELPQRLVDETFFWARRRAAVGRNGKVRRPIIFFRPAMALRAKRLGVDL